MIRPLWGRMADHPVPASEIPSDSEGSGRAGPNRAAREGGERTTRGSAPEDDRGEATERPRGRRHSRQQSRSDQEKGKGKSKGKGGGKKGKKGSKDNRSNSGGKKGDKGGGQKGKDMRTIIQEEMAKMIPMAASMMSMMNPVSVNSMAMGSAGQSIGPTHASTETAIPRNQNDLGWYEDANREKWYWHGKGWWPDWRNAQDNQKGSGFSHDSSIRSVRPAGNVKKTAEDEERPAAPAEVQAAPGDQREPAAKKESKGEVPPQEAKKKKAKAKLPQPLPKKEEVSPRRREARTRPAEGSPTPAAGATGGGQRPEAGPPGREERGAPSRKRVKAEPNPDPPDGDDGADWGGSEYSYTYETDPEAEEGEGGEGERGPESELATADPVVSVTSAATLDRPGQVPPRRPDGRARPPEPAEPPRQRLVLREAPRDPPPGQRRRRADRDGGGGGGGDDEGSDPSSAGSTAQTSEVRELLNLQTRRDGGERGKPSLSQVRIEQFKGNRDHYKEWKRTLEAQRSLYKLEDGELAMLIYLSTTGEPRAILNQLEIAEMREEGGLSRVLRLLDESFGARSDERFEQRQEEYLQFRRTPGMSISAYISTLKRLRTEYLREDEHTVISDKSFAQRLLTRAGLSRRERMDVFFSSGGKYSSGPIEKVLRFRCANVHHDEKRESSTRYKYGQRPRDERGHPTKPRKQMFPKRSDRKHNRPTRHHTHVADQEEDEPNEYSEEEEGLSELDREDFEQEALAEGGGDYGDEEYEDIPEEEGEEDDWDTVEQLKDAYAAGWRAKQQSAEQRKGRGYKNQKGKSKGKGTKKERAPDERKRTSRCSSCKQMGHWHGDACCPNVISGKDPPRDSGSSQVNFSEGGQASGSRPAESGGRVHRVNWSFMVNNGGWELLDHYASDSQFESSEESEGEVDPVLTAAPKRAEKPSSSTRRRKYKVALKTVLEALAAETDDEETQRRLKKKEYKAARQEAKRQKDKEHEAKREASFHRKKQGQTPMDTTVSPLEMLKILPHMTKEEKKELYKALKKEQEAEAALYLDPEASEEKMRRPERRTSGYSARRCLPLHFCVQIRKALLEQSKTVGIRHQDLLQSCQLWSVPLLPITCRNHGQDRVPSLRKLHRQLQTINVNLAICKVEHHLPAREFTGTYQCWALVHTIVTGRVFHFRNPQPIPQTSASQSDRIDHGTSAHDWSSSSKPEHFFLGDFFPGQTQCLELILHPLMPFATSYRCAAACVQNDTGSAAIQEHCSISAILISRHKCTMFIGIIQHSFHLAVSAVCPVG